MVPEDLMLRWGSVGRLSCPAGRLHLKNVEDWGLLSDGNSYSKPSISIPIHNTAYINLPLILLLPVLQSHYWERAYFLPLVKTSRSDKRDWWSGHNPILPMWTGQGFRIRPSKRRPQIEQWIHFSRLKQFTIVQIQNQIHRCSLNWMEERGRLRKLRRSHLLFSFWVEISVSAKVFGNFPGECLQNH